MVIKVRCPYRDCHQELDSLDAIVDERNIYSIFPDGDRQCGEGIESNDAYYKCPHCHRVVVITDEEGEDDVVVELFRGMAMLKVEPEKPKDMEGQLYLVRYEVRDGEHEYGNEYFIRAKSEKEAEDQAEKTVVWDYGDEGGKAQHDEYGSDWFEVKGDYRMFRVGSATPIESLEGLVSALGGETRVKVS